MSPRRTAFASVSVTVELLTATGLVSARSAAFPPTVTAKSPPAGSEPASVARSPSKVISSSSPFAAAEENAGGVLFVTSQRASIWVGGTWLPERSLRFLEVSATTVYRTPTTWP